MKTLINKSSVIALACLAPSVAFGGGEYHQPSSMPYQEPSLYQWFVGGSVGYLVDAEEEFYSLHLGRRLSNAGAWGQSIFFEVGYSDLENDGSEVNLSELGLDPGDSFTGDANIEATFVPITLNYMVDRKFTDRLGFYAGVGAGIALIDVDGDFSDDVLDINDSGNDSETSFFAQAFLGLNYAVSEQFELFAGARYMFIDEYDVSTDSGNLHVKDSDDALIEVGGRLRF